MSSQHHLTPHPLRNQIHLAIKAGADIDFNGCALELFDHQFTNNPIYRKFCVSQEVTPSKISRWQEIPAIPTRAFKIADFPLSEGTMTFLTSGTTTEKKGAHHFPDTETYDLAALTHWSTHLSKLPLFFLSPSPEESPKSSLSHMFGHLHDSLDEKNNTAFLLQNSKFQLSSLFENDRPIILAGTALAFLHLMESHQAIPLPRGSQLLETGGYKGTSRTLDKPDFYQQLTSFFDIPDSDIHNEYGMTELSSQAYASGSTGSHRFPHWCRYRILCPETERELPIGETGYLEIHDLANLHSVAAIRTQDFATGHPDGSFTLIGRDPSALPRGCSRSIDDSLTR